MSGEINRPKDFIDRRSKIPGREIPTYLLPFRLIPGSESRYQLGDDDGNQCLTVLLLGFSGSGKSMLVEVLGNYILGVEFHDVDRFQVRRKDGPTDTITSYTFFTRYTRRFPRPITVIDTPGFQRGTPGPDLKLIGDIRTFVHLHHKQRIDAVIYVVPGSQGRLTAEQKLVLGNMAKVLGDQRDKIAYLFCTFADSTRLPVLDSVKEARLLYKKHFPVNSSAYFVKDEEVDSSLNGDGEGSENQINIPETVNKLLFDLTTESLREFADDIDKNCPHRTPSPHPFVHPSSGKKGKNVPEEPRRPATPTDDENRGFLEPTPQRTPSPPPRPAVESSRAGSPFIRLREFCKRYPWVVLLVALVFIGVLIGAGFGIAYAIQDMLQQQRERYK